MANARTSNAMILTDYTDELLLIPNSWGLINELGLFEEQGISKHSVEFDETEGSLILLEDMPRGARRKYNKDEYSKLHSISVPHFNFDDGIKPEDVQGRRRIGTVDDDATIADVRARKMARMRRSWAATVEYARSKALQGTAYAPNGTVSYNWYTEMNQTQKVVDFALDVTTTDILAKIREANDHINDNIQTGESVSGMVYLCGTTFFQQLVGHASVAEIYKHYSSNLEPLRNIYKSGKFNTFEHGNVKFVEYRGSFNGNAIIPATECYAVPLGTMDMFKTYYSPAHKFDLVNTVGESQYMFEYDDGRGTEITIETESNFINVVRRPQAVVKCTNT